MRAGWTGIAALGLGVLTLGWEVQRRRDLAAVTADPAWRELNRPIAGRTRRVPSADGTQLHAEEFGPADAPAIVLAHGWTETLEFWHHQIRDLSADFRVIAYDQRGHGRSAVPENAESYTADSLAADFEAVLRACLRENERCLAVGHSMGGMTIVAWAGRHPVEVRRRLAAAAFINTGMNELTARALVLGPLVGARVHQGVIRLAATPRALATRLDPVSLRVVRRITTSRRASPGCVAFIHRMVLSCPAPVRAGFGRLFSDLDLSGSVADVCVPALVIAGADDLLTPPWHAEQLAQRLPDLRQSVVLPGVGHMSPLEAPQQVTSRLRRLAEATLVSASTARPRRRATGDTATPAASIEEVR